MAESDDIRASARQHTAQLLKMLRGYGPTTEPASMAESGIAATGSKPAVVAEAAAAYVRRLDPTSGPRRSPATVAADARPTSTPRGRAERSSIAPVGEMLRHQQGTLGELMAQANRLIRLGQIFRAYLPPHLHDHAVLIRLDQDGWVVHADSASWATRLRYALHNIREVLGQQLGFPLPKPHIRVVPVDPPPPPRRPRLTLTERNAKLLEATACNLSDERLSAALRQLAKHGGLARESAENRRR